MDSLTDSRRLEVRMLEGKAGLLRIGIARPASPSLGTILILNGRAEFIEKYRSSLEILVGWSYTAVIMDWSGQGGSWRDERHSRKGHVDDFAVYLDDIDCVLGWMRQSGMETIDLVIGHSMGGHLVLRGLVERDLRAAAAIFIAPMFDIRIGLPRWLARGVAGLGTAVGLARAYAPGQQEIHPARRRFESNPLTSDPELFESFRQLLLHHDAYRVGGVTYGWLRAAFRSIAWTWQPGYGEGLKLPMTVLTGEQDRIVSNQAAALMAARLLARHVDLAGARHDLLWEVAPVRDRLWREIRVILDALEANRPTPIASLSAIAAGA
ncbi:alpha/beta fold hydrolase [Arboricoccus pini]|nr:alpha/beta hydrolase [Arboricoccus pini]